MNTPQQTDSTMHIYISNIIVAYKLHWKISSGIVHVSPLSDAKGSTRIEVKNGWFEAQHWTDAEPLCKSQIFLNDCGLIKYVRSHPCHPWYGID